MTTMQDPPRSRTPRRILFTLMAIAAVLLLLWSTGVLKPRPKIAIVTASGGPYWDLIIRGAEDAANRYHYKLTIVRAKGDEPSQTQQLRDLVGRGFDGVAVSPNDPPRQAAALSDLAAEASLVTFDSDSPISNRICFVGTDNYDAGRMCGQQITQAVPGGGEVIIAIGSLDKENGQRRRQGVIDELLERSFERQRPMDAVEGVLKGPKYTIVATLVDGIDADKATTLAADAIKANPNVKCIAGLFAYSTPALLKALEQTQKVGQIQVVGFDAYEQTLNGIEAGTVSASICQDAYNIGFEAVRICGDAASGERRSLPLFPMFYLPCDSVTKTNVQSMRQDLKKYLSPTTKPA